MHHEGREGKVILCSGNSCTGNTEAESHAFFVSARLYDDGVIDPRDTRTVLGLTLSAVHSGPVAGRRGFGVFRM